MLPVPPLSLLYIFAGNFCVKCKYQRRLTASAVSGCLRGYSQKLTASSGSGPLPSITPRLSRPSGGISFSSDPQGEAHRQAKFLRLPQSLTGTGLFTRKLSGVTWHSRASTSTPAAAARRRAAPNSGWVASLGSSQRIPSIWMMKHTAAS